MRYKLKVWQKLVIAFGIIFLGFLANSLLTLQIVTKNNELNEKYQKIYSPSAKYIDELYKLINESRFLIKNWVWVEQKDINNSTDKMRLLELINESYPSLINKLDTLSINWHEESLNTYREAKKETKFLFEQHFIIMNDLLRDFASYSDPLSKAQAQMLVDPDFGEIMISSDSILSKLLIVSNNQNQLVKSSNEELTKSSNRLGTFIIFLTLIVGIFVVLIGSITTRSIVKPMVYIQNILLEMSKGKLPNNTLVESSNEVGQMSYALNVLINSSRKTSQFAEKVGNGEFDHQFSPLSEHDILGNSLVVMSNQLKQQIEQLKENEEFLEQKVEERTREVVAQKELIEKKNKDITSSINYAKRIQTAVLPSKNLMDEILPVHFIFFKPRDVVSGDFYWIKKVKDSILIAAADCTGHGVPGAFMSMLGISFLNEIVRKKEGQKANQVLDELRNQIKTTLRQTGKKNESRDGMDIAFCEINTETNILQYSGAYNSIYIIRNSELPELNILTDANKRKLKKEEKDGFMLTEIKADSQPIGFFYKESSFSNKQMQLIKDDKIYMFSDGFIDQHGGIGSRKFMSKNFKKMLLDIHAKPMEQQQTILNNTLNEWTKGHEQIDDILVIGIEV